MKRIWDILHGAQEWKKEGNHGPRRKTLRTQSSRKFWWYCHQNGLVLNLLPLFLLTPDSNSQIQLTWWGHFQPLNKLCRALWLKAPPHTHLWEAMKQNTVWTGHYNQTKVKWNEGKLIMSTEKQNTTNQKIEMVRTINYS